MFYKKSCGGQEQAVAYHTIRFQVYIYMNIYIYVNIYICNIQEYEYIYIYKYLFIHIHLNTYIYMNIYIYYKGIIISPSISYDRPILERATCLSQDARLKRLSSARCYHDFLFGIMK